MFGSSESDKEKTVLQLLEIELKRLHGQLHHSYLKSDVFRQIVVIQDHLMDIHKEQQTNLVPERIKSMENTIAELLMMGKEEKK